MIKQNYCFKGIKPKERVSRNRESSNLLDQRGGIHYLINKSQLKKVRQKDSISKNHKK